MLDIHLNTFTKNVFIPPHVHSNAQFNLLVKGSPIEYRGADLQVTETLHAAPDIWRVPAGSAHSCAVLMPCLMLSIGTKSTTKNSISSLRSRQFACLMMLLAIQSAKACDFTLEDLEQAQKEYQPIDIPDCFFNSLEASAAGGDPQAQLELGITLIEGYSDDPSDGET